MKLLSVFLSFTPSQDLSGCSEHERGKSGGAFCCFSADKVLVLRDSDTDVFAVLWYVEAIAVGESSVVFCYCCCHSCCSFVAIAMLSVLL